jgi:hypothetical protein
VKRWPGYASVAAIMVAIQHGTLRSFEWTDLAVRLTGAFIWGDTPPGQHFWEEVHRNLGGWWHP